MAGERVERSIDRDLFLMAFGRDVDYHDIGPQLVYLDRTTGDIAWLYETDNDAEMEVGIPAEENRQERLKRSRPSRIAIWRFPASIMTITIGYSGDS